MFCALDIFFRMDLSQSALQPRYETRITGPELVGPKNIFLDDASLVLLQIKKVLVYCCKRTRSSLSKENSDPCEEIGLDSVIAKSSSSSRRLTYRRRPTVLNVFRTKSNSTQRDSVESNHYNDCDPFITSPSWFKAEFLEEGTRPSADQSTLHMT
ncbi:hypothetical protein BDU57DRAFT_198220 [Ampelomyces quisqualis]|uniref:Uncharacterized protein n=1 Tax=Ampelomyces quisqualis TaxID=50730 RepID=A0A6A5QUD4_AMPQU|nr:hypothetical protein BDU57DRAFT_198220 [Ampelomyces quisqualis]